MLGSDKEVTIYYEPAGRIQNSEWNLVDYPPAGYRFIAPAKTLTDQVVANSFVFNKLRLQVLDKIMPLNLAKSQWDTKHKQLPEGTEVVYAYNHVILRPIPWVVLAEWGHVLVGRDMRFFTRYKSTVEQALRSEWCKGIFTWTRAAARSVLQLYDTTGFTDKVMVLPPAVPSKEFHRTYHQREVLKLLFVGSIDTVEDFAAKGGPEVIAAYRRLRRRYPKLELTIRARAPNGAQSGDGIRIIHDVLSRQELDNEFKSADIFVLPSHYAQEMVVLEAMSWGLPVVTSHVAGLGDWINSGVDGFVLPETGNGTYIRDHVLISETTNRHQLLRTIPGEVRSNTISELVSRLSSLLEDNGLREMVGRSARYTINSGRHSIAYRNRLLKSVLDKALSK